MMFFINENQFLIELSPYLKEKTKFNGFFSRFLESNLILCFLTFFDSILKSDKDILHCNFLNFEQN